MAGTIRAIYTQAPPFPATDNHPVAQRYQVGAWWVDAIGGEPTPAEVNAVLASPFVPDFGGEADDTETFRSKSQTAVDNLRAYLALSSPTAAQNVAALKVLIRVVLFLVRRAL